MLKERYIMKRLCELETAVNILEDEMYKLNYKAKKPVKKTTKKAK